MPPYKEPRVWLENSNGEWLVKDYKQMLYYNWDPEALADHHDPDDDGSSHLVHIAIMGYMEETGEDGELQVWT